MRSLVVVLACLSTLSGCLAPAPSDDAGIPTEPTTGAEPARPLLLHGTDCLEAGGHSVHPVMLNPLPEPWVPADVLDDVGDQWVYSEVPDPTRPVPERGSTMGNHHATVVCDWTFDGEVRPGMVFGFVGMKVETPPFGGPGPSHQYLVTVVAASDPDVVAVLRAGGIDAMEATAAVDQVGEQLAVHMETSGNGVYDSVFRRTDLGPMHAPWVRLWFQQHSHADGGQGYRPVALDMHSAGGVHFGAEGQGYFSHTGTDHHAPLPGAYGHTAALGYEGFERSFSWGPAPDVVLPAAYHH